MIKAIIFDLDGVLIDATEWHYEALNQALKTFGFEIKRDDHINTFNGLPTERKLILMSERQNLPVGLHGIIKSLKRKFTEQKISENCSPNHEKQLMLAYLKNKGYKIACCSNGQRYSVLKMLERAQIDHFFDEIIGNDEGYAPKPSPDIYLEAFKRLNLKPYQAVIIEDSPHGIAGARASGAKVIPVTGFNDVNLGLFINLKI